MKTTEGNTLASVRPLCREHELGHGRRVRIDPHEGTLQVTSPDGHVELHVRSTADGCLLAFENARIALSTPGQLDLRCEELRVAASRRIELNAGRLDAEADELTLCATRGDAFIQANDHVRLVGEKILLNSEHERRASRDQLEAFWRGLGL